TEVRDVLEGDERGVGAVTPATGRGGVSGGGVEGVPIWRAAIRMRRACRTVVEVAQKPGFYECLARIGGYELLPASASRRELVGGGIQLEVLNVLVLSWSEKLLTPRPVGSLTLVTPVTLTKEPCAEDMVPDTWAEKSVPAPTVLGGGPVASG